MKKFLAFVLAAVMAVVFCACGEPGTDSEEIKKRGKLVVGVTHYEPMNYKVDGEWTGFDTEFARLFAKEKLGIDAEFVEIEWSKRNQLLKENEIDCIWNGMTVEKTLQDDEMDVSDAYAVNSQVLVMNSEVVDNYTNGYDVRNLRFTCEKGSAGQGSVDREGYKNVTLAKTQEQALELVAKGTVDAAIIDSTMADALVGKGKKYPNLAKGFSYSMEYFAVAFRFGSDVTKMFNSFKDEIYDQVLFELAEKYNVTLA